MTTDLDRLSTLPDDLLGLVFGHVNRRASREALFHTCKAVHSSTACVMQV